MTRTRYEENEVHKLDLSKNETLLFGEAPMDIIGFSKIFKLERPKNEPPFDILIPPRIRLTNYEWLDQNKFSAIIKKLITDLQPPLQKSGDSVPSDELQREFEKYKGADVKDLFPEKLLARLTEDFKYFEINKPTLLIFTTNFRDRFGKPFIAPAGKDPLPQHLDKNCVSPRLWNNGTVLGWYSRYRHGDPGAVEKSYQYALHTPVPNSHGTFPSTFDPGNGNGGGSTFP